MPDSSSVQVQDGIIKGINIPFMNLTWFLVKLSFASALAFLLTSVLWIAIGVGVMMVLASLGGLLGGLGVFGPPAGQSASPQPIAPSEIVVPLEEPAPAVIAPSEPTTPLVAVAPQAKVAPQARKAPTKEWEDGDVYYSDGASQNADPARVMTRFNEGTENLSKFGSQNNQPQSAPQPAQPQAMLPPPSNSAMLPPPPTPTAAPTEQKTACNIVVLTRYPNGDINAARPATALEKAACIAKGGR